VFQGGKATDLVVDAPCAPLRAVQGYHELYELHRGRLEARLVRLTEERDSWSQLTFCLALKVREPGGVLSTDSRHVPVVWDFNIRRNEKYINMDYFMI